MAKPLQHRVGEVLGQERETAAAESFCQLHAFKLQDGDSCHVRAI